MGYFSERREIRKLEKLDKRNKRKSNIKKNLPTAIVLIGLTLLFFIHGIVTNISAYNLKLEDIFLDVNLQDVLTCPITEADLDSALIKLDDVGLTSISSRTTFTLANIQNNEQEPTTQIHLTNAEFSSLLVPLFYTLYGSTATVYEIAIVKNDTTYNITTVLGVHLKASYKNIKIDENIYIEENYILEENLQITFVDYQYININKSYTHDISNDVDKDYMQEFLTFVFTKNENSKTLIELLNYDNFSIIDNDIVLS